LESVKGYYRRVLEDEVRNALGLYRNESYQDLFTRYIGHVSAWTKKERLFDPVIKKQVEADGQFMKNIEQSLLAKNESSEDFRRQLISEIGAFKLENPEADLEYELLFSSHIKRLKEEAYKEQSHVVERILRALLQILDGDSGSLEERDINQAGALKEGLFAAGYNLSSVRWAMVFLLKEDTVLDRDQQLGLKIDKYQ
jgi:predicted Ser/Thr protein kinase